MMRRLLPAGLTGRLVAAIVSAALLTVAGAFVVVYRDTGTQVRARIDRSIRGAAIEMERAVVEDEGSSARQLLQTAREYVASQPYGSTPALLFMIAPGLGTASNQAEMFGQDHDDDGESNAEQAQENVLGRRLKVPHVGYHVQSAPDIGSLQIYEERVATPGGADVYVGAAEPLSEVADARRGVARSFLLAGGLAVVLAVISASLMGRRISRPLRRVAAVAARVDAGDLTPRMPLAPNAVRELSVLGDAFNHMLDRLEEGFAAQRDFVADASHELRTPLTVLRGQLELLGADEATGGEGLQHTRRIMQAEVARLTRMVDDLLLLAQTGQRDFLNAEPVELETFINELWDGLSLTAERDFVVGELVPVTITADPDRLAQALRNLARNAISHTEGPTGLVRIDVTTPSPTTVRLAVSDDGPGIPKELRARVFERFYRTDPARTRAAGGAGLGLAIVQAIVEAHGGCVRVGDATPHGARVEIDLPRG